MRPKIFRLLIFTLVSVLSYYFILNEPKPGTQPPAPTPGTSERARTTAEQRAEQRVPTHAYSDAADRIRDAYQRGLFGFMVESEGVVERLLSDDTDGNRHQRFILRLPNGHTLLVAHNIDLAERVPARVGDTIRIYGQYEHNDRGGVLHWTHRATGRDHESGWIEHKGVRYQ